MEKSYYVYAFLDSSKPGKYVYLDIVFDYEPFYIGKGCENRIKHSLSDRESSFKVSKIKSMINNDIEIISTFVYENLGNIEALEYEKILIKKIGRRDLKEGPLVNQTAGGDGRLESPHSEDTKRKISETKKKQGISVPCTEEMKKYLSGINSGEKNPFYGKTHTDEVKRIQSERFIGISHPMFGMTHSEDTKRLISESRNLSVDQGKHARLSKERNSKVVVQYTLDGDFIREYESVKVASQITGLSESLIGKTCRNVVKNPRKFLFNFKSKESSVMVNSFRYKIGEILSISGSDYTLLKRMSKSFLVERDGVEFTFRRTEFPFVWSKKSLEAELN
jgi:group I intron endonuclease